MNYVNMRKLITHLEWLEEQGKGYKFDMSNWIELDGVTGFSASDVIQEGGPGVSPYSCNTTACIAGHAALIGGAHPGDDIEEWAKVWLGLSRLETDYLFYGDWSPRPKSSITPQEAIAYLRSICPEET